MYSLPDASRAQRVDIDTTDSKAGKSATAIFGGADGIVSRPLKKTEEKPLNSRLIATY
jgi:hypothetical protein